MSLLSKSCEYGLRAAMYLAGRDEKTFVPIRTIAADLGLSFPFLTKILQQLTDAGIITSSRGPKGGVKLARPASGITLAQIVEGIDGPDIFRGCVLGLSGCGSKRPCPMHHLWAVLREELRQKFRKTTLAAMGRRMAEAGVRLTD